MNGVIKDIADLAAAAELRGATKIVKEVEGVGMMLFTSGTASDVEKARIEGWEQMRKLKDEAARKKLAEMEKENV